MKWKILTFCAAQTSNTLSFHTRNPVSPLPLSFSLLHIPYPWLVVATSSLLWVIATLGRWLCVVYEISLSLNLQLNLRMDTLYSYIIFTAGFSLEFLPWCPLNEKLWHMNIRRSKLFSSWVPFAQSVLIQQWNGSQKNVNASKQHKNNKRKWLQTTWKRSVYCPLKNKNQYLNWS